MGRTSHSYSGLGMLVQYAPAARLVLAANALLGHTGDSYITANSGPGLTGFSGELGNSRLYRVGLSADFAFTRTLHGNLGVERTAFKYGMSGLYPSGGGVAWEPDSRTTYTTFRIGLGVAL